MSAGEQAAALMMRGATDYLHARMVTPCDELLDLLVVELRAGTAAAVEESLKDAKACMEANMPLYIGPNFSATMRLAGIDAAKRAIEKFETKVNAYANFHEKRDREIPKWERP